MCFISIKIITEEVLFIDDVSEFFFYQHFDRIKQTNKWPRNMGNLVNLLQIVTITIKSNVMIPFISKIFMCCVILFVLFYQYMILRVFD